MREEVVDRNRQEVVGVHEPAVTRDDAVTVGVGVIAREDVEVALVTKRAGHREAARAVHADLLVPVKGHERPARVDLGVDHREVDAVALGDELVVLDSGAAEGVCSEADARLADRAEVDDVLEGGDVVLAVVGRLEVVFFDGAAQHVMQAVGDDRVGAVGDPLGGVAVGRAAVGRVVLEAAVARRIVAGCDDDAVGLVAALERVVGDDRAAQRRSGHPAVA